MTNNGPVDSHIISLLQKGAVKQVVPFIEQLQSTHDIDAVHDEINHFLNPTLWLAFLNNQAIQPQFSEAKLKDMYLTALLRADSEPQKGWQAVLESLTVFKKQIYANIQKLEDQFTKAAEWEDIPTQCKVLAKLPKADANSVVYKALLTSTHSALWQAFISNRMLTASLLKTQYAQLVENLQSNVKGCSDEQSRKEWLIVLAIYALKLYPANYSEKICPEQDASDKTARFGILLDYAVTQIQTYGQLETKDANIETVRWLLFAIKLAEHPPTLALWQTYSLFQQTLPFQFNILGTVCSLQFLNIFPNFFSELLKHIYSCKAEYGNKKYHPKYRELISLIKLLAAHPQFGVIINADPVCCELLGIMPTQAAPPSSSASSSPMLTDDDDAFGLAPIIEIVDDETVENEDRPPMTEPDIFEDKNIDEESLDEISLQSKESTPLLPKETPGIWQRLFTPCFSSCFNRRPPQPPSSDHQSRCLDFMGAIVRFGQARRP